MLTYTVNCDTKNLEVKIPLKYCSGNTTIYVSSDKYCCSFIVSYIGTEESIDEYNYNKITEVGMSLVPISRILHKCNELYIELVFNNYLMEEQDLNFNFNFIDQ